MPKKASPIASAVVTPDNWRRRKRCAVTSWLGMRVTFGAAAKTRPPHANEGKKVCPLRHFCGNPKWQVQAANLGVTS